MPPIGSPVARLWKLPPQIARRRGGKAVRPRRPYRGGGDEPKPRPRDLLPRCKSLAVQQCRQTLRSRGVHRRGLDAGRTAPYPGPHPCAKPGCLRNFRRFAGAFPATSPSWHNGRPQPVHPCLDSQVFNEAHLW